MGDREEVEGRGGGVEGSGQTAAPRSGGQSRDALALDGATCPSCGPGLE